MIQRKSNDLWGYKHRSDESLIIMRCLARLQNHILKSPRNMTGYRRPTVSSLRASFLFLLISQTINSHHSTHTIETQMSCGDVIYWETQSQAPHTRAFCLFVTHTGAKPPPPCAFCWIKTVISQRDSHRNVKGSNDK